MRTAFYPGTFDPVTNGHLDLIRRALRLFDRVVVGVGTGRDKEPMFTVEERVEFIRGAVADLSGVEVTPFDEKAAWSKSPSTVSGVATSMARSWSEPCQLSEAASWHGRQTLRPTKVGPTSGVWPTCSAPLLRITHAGMLRTITAVATTPMTFQRWRGSVVMNSPPERR